MWIPKDTRCLNHKCINNSTCKPRRHNSTDSFEGYECKCKLGFIGKYCEKDIRPCTRVRCLNNATCVSSEVKINEFTCVCHPGFSGKLCQINLSCINVTCHNGGQCMEGNNNFTCLCGNYFSGRHCEIKDGELAALETASYTISIVAMIIVVFHVFLIVFLDLLKYIFKMEPQELKDVNEELHDEHILEIIKRERKALYKRYFKVNYAVKKMHQFHFHNIRFRNLKFIDESSCESASAKSIKKDLSYVSVAREINRPACV